MEEKVLSSIGGVGAFGVFSVCLFFVFFTAMIIWVARLTKCYLNSMGQLPLAGDEPSMGPAGNGTDGAETDSDRLGATADARSSAIRSGVRNL